MNLKKIFNDIINYLDYDLILLKTLYIVLILIGAIIVYFVVRIIVKRILSLSIRTISKKQQDVIKRRQRTLEKIIFSLWRYFIYFVTFLIILSQIGVNIDTILAGAGILGVVFAVGSQNLMKDFLEGFFNIFENNISVGDYVDVDNVEGNIIDIGLRNIKIKSFTGEIHIVPNSKIGHMINYSLDNGKALVDILIDYDSDVEEALNVIRDTLTEIKSNNANILSTPNILGVNKLDKIGYEIRIMCTTVTETHWGVQRYMRSEIMKSLKNHHIMIGKNQITVMEKQ